MRNEIKAIEFWVFLLLMNKSAAYLL